MLRRCLLVVAALAALSTASFATAIGSLTAKDIDDAIALGTRGNPEPYLLHHAGGTPTRRNEVIVGAVYTPFLRAALFAKSAYAAGYNVTREDIPPRLLDPVVQVAYRWYSCYQRDDGTCRPETRPDLELLIPGSRSARRFRYLHPSVAPLMVTPDTSVLNAFGGPPFEDIALVATYPLQAFSPGADFVIYWENSKAVPGEISAVVQIGRITAEDVARWR